MVKEGSMDKKIAEQISELNLQYLTLCKCRDDYSPAMVEPELTEAILALIEQERKDNADGLTVAYMMGAEDMKAKYKPMVEALKEAKEFVEAYIEQYKPQYSNPKNLLAEIDAVLQKGEG